MSNPVHGFISQWFRLREKILPALDLCGSHGEADVVIGILAGDYQFWPGEKSAIVTEVREFPKAKTIHFWLVGGDLDEVLQIENSVNQWAKSIGCTQATATGRKGWLRALPHWSFESVSLTRKI